MKKLLLLLMFSFSLATITHAQDTKDKTKQTSTIPQKAHNAVSKHKKHNGVKAKHKHNDATYKTKYDKNNGEVKKKTDK
jgi:predicted secreted protein